MPEGRDERCGKRQEDQPATMIRRRALYTIPANAHRLAAGKHIEETRGDSVAQRTSPAKSEAIKTRHASTHIDGSLLTVDALRFAARFTHPTADAALVHTDAKQRQLRE